MDTNVRRRLILSIIVITLVDLSIMIYVFWNNIFTIRVMLGSFSIVNGIVVIYNVAFFPYFVGKKKIVKYALIANPLISMIFAGVGLLLYDEERYFVLFLLSILGALVFFLIGFVLILYYLIKYKAEG